MKALAGRVVDEALFSERGNLRGGTPDDDEDTSGLVDGLGILPSQQKEILIHLDMNRDAARAPFSKDAFNLQLDVPPSNAHMVERLYVWSDFRSQNGDMPARILARTLEHSRGVGEDHRFSSVDDLIKAIKHARTTMVSAPTGENHTLSAVRPRKFRAPAVPGR